MEVRGTLTEGEIESFLQSAVIPVRIGCRTPSGGLWMLSLWYRYADGQLHCATSADAAVVTYIEHDSDVAFEVSTNEQPYAGVRGRGTASVADDPEKTVLRELLERYQGGTDTQLARRLLREERDEVSITIEPSTVYGWDFGERTGPSPE